MNLDRLRSACGSKDTGIVESVYSAEQGASGRQKPVDETKGPRILVTWKSDILLNGQPVTKEELKNALLDSRWTGTMLYQFLEAPPRGESKQGEFSKPGSFANFLYGLAPFFQEHGTTFRDQFVGICSVSSLESLADLEKDSDSISDDDALLEIVNGKFSKPECGSVYGYALERLCNVLGTRLDDVGTNRLKSLELDTALTKIRSPVKLPKYRDFPYISFLERDEVQEEYGRLCTITDIFGEDDEFDAERRLFVRCLNEALTMDCGIVGFYY